jgi:hypothetical protein
VTGAALVEVENLAHLEKIMKAEGAGVKGVSASPCRAAAAHREA